MKIEERWPCPRCGNRRRILYGAHYYFCFNCHFTTNSHDRPAQFTEAEVARLTVYRAAIRRGLYTDEVPARA